MSKSWIPVALVSAAFAAALAGIEGFAPHSHPAGETTAGPDEHAIREFLVVLAIIAVAAAVVFGVVVRRGLRKESAAWMALVLSILGFLTVAVFWSGLPPVLAGGGILLGWVSRDAVRGRWAAWAAIGLGVVALVADLAIYVEGMA